MKTKLCYRCKEELGAECFHKDKRSSDGLASPCKTCKHELYKSRYSDREYRERILVQQRERYATDESAREKKRQYVLEYRSVPENRDRYREYNRQYDKTDAGKEVKRKAAEKYAVDNQDKRRAKAAVNNAVRAGKLPPIKTLSCQNCGGKAQNYHHPSYDEDKWLDVVPLCRQCHVNVHTAPDQ